MTKAILSDKYPQFSAALREHGYETIPSERVERFIPYERDHADMQCLILDDTAFVLSCCRRLAEALSVRYNVVLCADDIGADYPRNVALNAAAVGKNVICNVNALDDCVKQYCNSHGYTLIHVKQGYAKCSCAIVSDNALITADQGICRALQGSEIDVLPIGKGSVRLDGANCGFIGGASGYDNKTKTLYFCGDICRHPDYKRIERFCEKHGTKIVSLTDDDLTDIGGVLFC